MRKLFFVFLMLTSIAMTAQEVTLRLNYNVGDIYKVTLEVDQSLGMLGKTNTKMEMQSSVTKVTDENITTEIKATKIQGDVRQGNESYSYNSAEKKDALNKVEKQMQERFQPTLNAIITHVKNKYGTIIDAKVEPLVPNLEKFGQEFEYPEAPITIGSTWTLERGKEKADKVIMTYKVDRITDTTVYASITGTVTGSKVEGILEVDIASGNPNRLETAITTMTPAGDILIKTAMTSTKM